jgi:hypothetical protein
MTAPIEAQLDRIRRRFKKAKLELLEISGSFRVYLNCGEHAYIHPETYENQIAVTIETDEPCAEHRTGAISRIRGELAELLDFARIGAFGLKRKTRTKWIYTARVHVAACEAQDPGAGPAFQSAAAPLSLCLFSAIPREIAIEDLQELLGMLDRHRLEEQLDWMYVSSESPVRRALRTIMKCKADTERLHAMLEVQARLLAIRDQAFELDLLCRINQDIVLQPILDHICSTVKKIRSG